MLCQLDSAYTDFLNQSQNLQLSDWSRLLFFRRFRPVFQNISRLTFEVFANGFERGKANGPGLAGFEDGKILRRDVHAVGQIVQPHFPLGENHVEIDDDGHKLKR